VREGGNLRFASPVRPKVICDYSGSRVVIRARVRKRRLRLTRTAVPAGVKPSGATLRYYDELGLVRPTGRVSGHRRYADDAVTAVGVVGFLQDVGFTLAEARRILASRKRSPVAWRALAARKAEELRLRIAREEAARQAIEHSLVCPKDNIFDCPNFWATVNAVLSGHELANAASGGRESAENESGSGSAREQLVTRR
jgi:DNA-binding transcriptional MerR regulator